MTDRELAHVLPPGTDMALLADDVEVAKGYAEKSLSEGTRTAYQSDVSVFQGWCEARSVPAAPASPEVVASFAAWQAEQGLRPSTISRRLAAIGMLHRASGVETPTSSEIVTATMRGIRREHGAAPARKRAATSEVVLSMLEYVGDDLKGVRDRAILTFGFASACRRSELASLTVDHVTEVDQGLIITIERSKTDQEAQGQEIAVPRGSRACPVVALRAWLDAAGIEDGPLFRRLRRGGHVTEDAISPRTIATVVKKYAALAGLDPDDFGGHSLRSGFATSAAANGATLFRLMDQTRHQSVETVRGYVRRAGMFEDHAGEGLL
jgi:site-specific recombinase XerD